MGDIWAALTHVVLGFGIKLKRNKNMKQKILKRLMYIATFTGSPSHQ